MNVERAGAFQVLSLYLSLKFGRAYLERLNKVFDYRQKIFHVRKIQVFERGCRDEWYLTGPVEGVHIPSR